MTSGFDSHLTNTLQSDCLGGYPRRSICSYSQFINWETIIIEHTKQRPPPTSCNLILYRIDLSSIKSVYKQDKLGDKSDSVLLGGF